VYAATALHAKKINLVYPDIPGTGAIFSAVIGSIAKAKASTLSQTAAVPLSANDVSAQVAATTRNHPGAVIAVLPTAQCGSLLQAHASLGPKVPLVMAGQCIEGSVLSQAGSSANGVYTGLLYYSWNDTNNHDVQIYLRALHKYGASHMQESEAAENSFSSLVTFAQVLRHMSGTINAASVLTALHGVQGTAFLGGAFNCNNRLSFAPAVCATGERFYRVGNGKLVDAGKWYDGTPFIKVP
jgi:ABC-type branched-subunit amino acid transport system substrate-binding protein